MTLLVVIIILALIFDYINGFHDAANSIANGCFHQVLTPFQAVIHSSGIQLRGLFYLPGSRRGQYHR